MGQIVHQQKTPMLKYESLTCDQDYHPIHRGGVGRKDSQLGHFVATETRDIDVINQLASGQF